jgi:transposase
MTWINLSGKSIAAARRPRRCLCAVTVHRLLERFRSDGPAAIRHRARGRVSNRRIDPAVREFAMTLVGESYPDFGPTLAAEKLQEDHGLTVSRETLRQWMQDAGIWLSRKQRRTFHQPRLRVRSSLVRGPRRALHPSCLRRRCHRRECDGVPPPVSETPVCIYAAMGWLSICSRLNWAGERWPCRSISQCSL